MLWNDACNSVQNIKSKSPHGKYMDFEQQKPTSELCTRENCIALGGDEAHWGRIGGHCSLMSVSVLMGQVHGRCAPISYFFCLLVFLFTIVNAFCPRFSRHDNCTSNGEIYGLANEINSILCKILQSRLDN